MSSIFTKQQESLLAGLGFTFQPIKRSKSGSLEGADKNKIYQLYEDLIAKQSFNPTNLQLLLDVTKECLNLIGNDGGDAAEWNFEEYFLLIFVLLSFYISQNYTGPELNPAVIPTEFQTWFDQEQLKSTTTGESHQEEADLVQNSLILDGEELVENINYPIIVVIVEKVLNFVESSFILKKKDSVCDSLDSNHGFILWWKIRTWFLHQQLLEERSQELFKLITKAEQEFLVIIGRLEEEQEMRLQGPIQAMFYVELSDIYLYYYDIEKAKQLVELAKTTALMKAHPAGVLGRRTKFQQTDLAQLVLHVELITNATEQKRVMLQSLDQSTFPQNILLDDDVRLEQIKLASGDTETLSSDISAGHLTPLQHLVLLSDFRARSKYLPNDGIYLEELLAYLQYLIAYPKLWSVQFISLFRRSLLENDQRRTIERSMNQLQSLKVSLNSNVPVMQERIKCFFGSGQQFIWEVEHGLAKILTSLGLYKEALDISLRLRHWEDVISYYNLLNLRHKAEEVIREELAKNNESVKFWIYLGDATDDIEHYEKAWTLSKCKSSRAQRQWGNYYFARKEYEKSIEHFELSLKLNPLEQLTWIRLGYASLQCEKWELSTKAYQHATELDSDNFELWNNLANGFLKSGNKLKALRALREAVKCNYENWKVWENLLVVATDCKVFEEVLRAYNRLIDLKTKWEDEQVLTIFVQAIVVNIEDESGALTRPKYLKDTLKLFGRITSAVRGNPTIWKLYSELQTVVAAEAKSNTTTDLPEDVSETPLYNSVTYMERAIKCIITDLNWNKVEPKMEKASGFVAQYIERILEFQQFQSTCSNSGSSEQLKNDAQFLIKKVYNGIKQTSQSAINPESLHQLMNKLQEEMKQLGFHIE